MLARLGYAAIVLEGTPEVMKITHNVVLFFIQFLFRSSNYQEQFWIADCGLRIGCIACALSIFIKSTEYLKSKFQNLKSPIYAE